MIREGILPVVAGTVVTFAGAILRGVDMEKRGMNKKDITPMLGAGLVGFGLAHIALGTMDLVQRRR